MNDFFHVKSDRWILLLLTVPTILALAITAFWESADLYTLTGDEPHYLLIAESLIHDQNLMVENNYYDESPVEEEAATILSEPKSYHQKHVRNGYPVHGIGLPILLILPYAIGEVSAAKMFMVVLAGFAAFLLYRVARQILDSKFWALLVALTIACSLPLVASGNQIYPDLLAGLIILYLCTEIVNRLTITDAEFSSWSSLWIGMLIGFLPWLHIRFLAPALVLLIAYVYAIIRARSRRESPVVWWLVIASIAPMLFSSSLLAFYNYKAFNNFLGPYVSGSLSYAVDKVGMVFLGLHWDQAEGMFMQDPFVLFGLLGLVPLVKSSWRTAVLLGIVYLSILLPASMGSTWYGGASFVGRFGLAAIGLWIFPLSHSLRLVLQSRHYLVLLFTMILNGVFQLLLARYWIVRDNLLFHKVNDAPIWLSANSIALVIGSKLGLVLPSFNEFGSYAYHLPNYLAVFLGILLIVTGFLWTRWSRRFIAMMWLVFLLGALALLQFIPTSISPWSRTADGLPGEVGKVEGSARIARAGESPEGFIFLGPYLGLMAGRYSFRLEYESMARDDAAVASWDLVLGYKPGLIGKGTLPPSSTNNGIFTYNVSIEKSQSISQPVQLRINYLGKGNLIIKKLTITPLAIGSP